MDELEEGKHFIEGVTDSHSSTNQKKTMWTKRGVIRLGFFIKTPMAKEFRDWAEEQNTINNAEVNSVNARDLWENLEVKTKFSDWIVRRLEDSMFVEGQDYILLTIEKNSVGQPAKEYIVTLEMAKHLAMMEKTGKGFEVRQYFIDAEKELHLLYIKYSICYCCVINQWII